LLTFTCNYIVIVTLRSLVTLQGIVCIHVSGEVDSFNAHCPALTAVAKCQIWWKFCEQFFTVIAIFGLLFVDMVYKCISGFTRKSV